VTEMTQEEIFSMIEEREKENRAMYGDNKYAVVSNGVVLNVIEWDGTTPLQVDGELVHSPYDNAAAIGGSYVDGQFLPPPEPEVDPPVEG
jgi:hypothetical protein